MACLHQVRRSRPRSSVNLHTVRIWKRLQVLVSVRRVVRYVVPALMQSSFVEPLRSSVCLRTVDCGETAFGAQYSSYKVEETGNELLSVVE